MSIEELKSMYIENAEFKRYVDKQANDTKKSVEYTLDTVICEQYAEYLKEKPYVRS